MELVKLCARNLLKAGEVSQSTLAPYSDYPISRLYDGDRNDLWKAQGTGVCVIDIDLSSQETVDFFAVDRQNFAGKTLTLRYDPGTGMEDIQNFTGLTNGVSYQWILGSSYTADSFQIQISYMEDPQAAEFTLAQRTFNVHPDFPGPNPSIDPNHDISYSRSGHRWGVKFGEEKNVFSYKFTISDTQMTAFLQNYEATDYGLRPFYMYDHDGTCRFVEFLNPPEWKYEIPGGTTPGGMSIDPYYQLSFTVREVF